MGRRYAAALLVGGVVAALFTTAPASSTAGFGDVRDGAFYDEPVQWMVNEAITTGTSPNCFSPEAPVTRGQAAAFMWRMEGFPTGSPLHPFTDIESTWQIDPVSWMFDLGITTGTTDTTYSPDDVLTRGQLAALLWRLAGRPGAPAPDQFPDVVASWQITPVGWMVQEGITTGTSPTTFSPNDTVTRGQLATFFYRYKHSPPVFVDIAHPDDPPCATQQAGLALPGAGSSVRLAHSPSDEAAFEAEVLRQLLQELGYSVGESVAEGIYGDAFGPLLSGAFDVRVHNFLPLDYTYYVPPFEEPLHPNDAVTIGSPVPLPQGFLITKSAADTHGITSIDEINADPTLVELFDDDGNGLAEIAGCPETWTCHDVIDSMIAHSGWTNLEQLEITSYSALAAAAASAADNGVPLIFFAWTPSPYYSALEVGTNLVWAEVDSVLDASNPLGLPSGRDLDQRPGVLADVANCPGADVDGCQLGWTPYVAQRIGRAGFLQSQPAAAALLERFAIPHLDFSQSVVDCTDAACLPATAAAWIESHRSTVAGWLRAAFEAGAWEWRDVPPPVASCPLPITVPLRRAELFDALWRLDGMPGGLPEHPFTDVPAAYESSARWAVATGLSVGTGPTTYGPNHYVVRGQLVVFLYRHWLNGGGGGSWPAHPYLDIPGGSFYETAADWSAANDVIQAYSGSLFGPSDWATHEATARAISFFDGAFDYYDC